MIRLELPSHDLHSFEGLNRTLECLAQLQESSSKAFSSISARMNAISSRISTINDKRANFERKIDLIEKSNGQYNLKFWSLARYPFVKKTKIGKEKAVESVSLHLTTRLSEIVSNNIPSSSDSKGKAPEVKYEEVPDLINKNYSKVTQFHDHYEGEFSVMTVHLITQKKVEGFGKIPKNLKFATSLLISNSNLNPYSNQSTAESVFTNFIFGRKKSKIVSKDSMQRMVSTDIPETMVGQNNQIIGERMDLNYKPIKKEAEDLMVSSRLKLRNIVMDEADYEEEIRVVQKSKEEPKKETSDTKSELHERPLPSIKPEAKAPVIETATFKESNIPKPPPNIPKPPQMNIPTPPPPPLLQTPAINTDAKDLKDLPKPQADRGSLLEDIRRGKKLKPVASAPPPNERMPAKSKTSLAPTPNIHDMLKSVVFNRWQEQNIPKKEIVKRNTIVIQGPNALE